MAHTLVVDSEEEASLLPFNPNEDPQTQPDEWVLCLGNLDIQLTDRQVEAIVKAYLEERDPIVVEVKGGVATVTANPLDVPVEIEDLDSPEE